MEEAGGGQYNEKQINRGCYREKSSGKSRLKVLVSGYDKLSKNTWADYDHYATLFEKKKDRWENVEIEYGNKGK